jgi:membrane-bound ClpP family serine protease
MVVLTILFISFCIFNILAKPFKNFDSVPTSIEAILLIAYCIVYLFEEVNKPQITFIYSSFHFWIVIAILIYFSATFFLFVYAASLPIKTAQDYWVISHISNILKNIFFATSFVIHAKTPNKPTKQHPTEYQPFLN